MLGFLTLWQWMTGLGCVFGLYMIIVRLRACSPGNYQCRVKYTLVCLGFIAAAVQPWVMPKLAGAGTFFVVVSCILLMWRGALPFKEYKEIGAWKDTELYIPMGKRAQIEPKPIRVSYSGGFIRRVIEWIFRGYL